MTIIAGLAIWFVCALLVTLSLCKAAANGDKVVVRGGKGADRE